MWNFDKLKASLNLRNTLLAMIACLLLMVANIKWQARLRSELEDKKGELSEVVSLLSSGTELKSKGQELASLKASWSNSSSDAWKDKIPSLISDQSLVLRQVRPLGVEQRGKIKEDQLLVQVEGDMKGIVGFLHAVSSSEMPIYVGQASIATQTVGSGFVTVEIVLSKPVVQG